MTTKTRSKVGSGSNKNKSGTPAKKASSKKRNWPNIALNIFIACVIGGAIAVGLKSFKGNWEVERDLSVVGNGTPTIVQVHDSGCRLCKKLKANTETALKSINGDYQYRIADIKTPKGKTFQNRYDVPHVTLLLFDKDGELERTLTGVRDSDELISIFKQYTG